MWRLYGKKRRENSPSNILRILYVCLIAVGCLLIFTASRDLLTDEREYSAAQLEYIQLREMYPIVSEYRAGKYAPTPPREDDSGLVVHPPTLIASPTPNARSRVSNSDYQIRVPVRRDPADPIVGLVEINPDFVGWISIEGVIDYPVVQGRNNSRYLNTTFTGQRNASGTIFVDSRQPEGFSGDVCIIYGHNMRDGSMFAPLKQYLSAAFMEANPNITVVTSDGELLDYLIFAARQTDIRDAAYALNFKSAAAGTGAFSKAPDGARSFLLLSTCTNSPDKEDRLLVYAALID